MMKDIEIKISRETRMVDLSKTTIGNDGENLQGNLVFSFTDDFVKGQGRLEYVINGESKYAFLLSNDENYYIPIKSVMTKEGQIDMQLVITEGTDVNEIPIFKSNVFYVSCKKSINAEVEEEEEYYSWIEIANTKLNEIDEVVEDIETKLANGEFNGKDGVDGKDGKDFTYEDFTEEQLENLRGPQGVPGEPGADGEDYVLTEADKEEIADNINGENNDRITENEKDIVDLETYLDTITPKNTAKGELVHITDALPLTTFKNKIDGNVKQEGEPSPTSPQEIEVIEGDLSFKVNGKNLSPINNKTITGTTSASSTIGGIRGTVIVKDIPISQGSYTLSYNKPNGINGLGLFLYNDLLNADAHNTTYVEIVSGGRGINLTTINENTGTFKIPSGYEHLAITISNDSSYPANTNVTIEISNFQLEKGSVATPYEPYKEQITYIDLKGNEVAKGDNIIIDKKGNVSLVKNIDKIVLDGSENWFKSSTYKGSFYGRVFKGKKNAKPYGLVWSDYFKRADINGHQNYTNYKKNTMFLELGGVESHVLNCWFGDENTTVEEWITWLSNNNMTLYYETETTETIYLGKLEEPIKTFEGVNNIQLLANLDTEIEVTYALDVKKYFENKLASIQEQIL